MVLLSECPSRAATLTTSAPLVMARLADVWRSLTELMQLALFFQCIALALQIGAFILTVGVISDADFITAMVLLLLALFFVQLGDHAAEREVQRRRYIDRRHARPEEPECRQNRRDT